MEEWRTNRAEEIGLTTDELSLPGSWTIRSSTSEYYRRGDLLVVRTMVGNFLKLGSSKKISGWSRLQIAPEINKKPAE